VVDSGEAMSSATPRKLEGTQRILRRREERERLLITETAELKTAILIYKPEGCSDFEMVAAFEFAGATLASALASSSALNPNGPGLLL
jgi:hypothetical protein